MLKGQAPCESLIKGKSQFFFENPLITYRVVQAQRDEKIWVRYPLNQSLALLEPPTHVTAQVPHAQFFVEYEVAVNGPQPPSHNSGETSSTTSTSRGTSSVTGRNASRTSGPFIGRREHVGRHDPTG
jgi:hypothetical protein